MTTPTRHPSGVPLHNLVPSGSFLQQLLEEINGSGTPTVLRNRPATQDTPRAQPNSAGSRRTSSVWVGGTTIAEDARRKLRAADEARLQKSTVSGTDGAPDLVRPTLHLRIPRFDAPVASFDRSSTEASPGEPCLPATTTRRFTAHDISYALVRDADSAHSHIVALPHPVSTTHTSEPSSTPSDVIDPNSPPIFWGPLSATSATSSPSEPPTSAISATSTDATTVSHGQYGSYSPGKRALLQPPSPELLPKKMRTMTLPLTGGRTIAHSSTSHSSGRASIGGDNRCVIHASTFTERAPAPLDHLDPILASTMPELSSFRPQAADAQGVPRPSLTPARPATRRSSMIARDESPEPAETPSWARSLHLVDTDVSIYKKIHGDEWKDFPLCLHCFRRHGNFNKIEEHGYEVCGREEMLESHYWQ